MNGETIKIRKDDCKKVVDDVYSNLEILKYIGAKDAFNNEKSSGEGIQIDIVSLPDLVLDIRKYHFREPSENVKTCAIGGRASRVACILAHLLNDTDGIYTSHLVTRTNNLGKMLIENEFIEETQIGNSKLQTYIDESREQPRCTIWNKQIDKNDSPYYDDAFKIRCGMNCDGKGELKCNICGKSLETPLFEPQTQRPGESLCLDYIQNDFEINQLLYKARVIYFSSIKLDNFIELINYVHDFILTKQKASLFIDCTRLDERHENYIQNFKSVFEHSPLIIDGIILSENEEAIIKNAFGAGYFMDCLEKVDVLRYSNKDIYWKPKSSAPILFEICEPESGILFGKEDVPERFKAGFLLAYGLHNAIEQLEKEIFNTNSEWLKLVKIMHDAWKENPWERIITFGIALAIVEENGKPFCSFEDFIGEFNGLKDKHLFNEEIDPLNIINAQQNIHISKEHTDELVKAAGLRRTKKENFIENINSNHCGKADCDYKESKIKPNTAILIDLDSTLMNSSHQRDRCLSHVFEYLLSLDGFNEIIDDQNILFSKLKEILPEYKEFKVEMKLDKIKFLLNLFNEYIYGKWPIYNIVELGDFRQQWNCDGWYATLFVLLKDTDIIRHISDNFSHISKNALEEEVKSSGKDKIEDILNQCDFLTKYKMALFNYSEYIDLLKTEFLKTKMYPYKEAFDFLQTFKNKKNYRIYVVTEGDPETQWMKLKSTGLSEYFKRDCVLATGELKGENLYLKEIKKERRLVENEFDNFKKSQIDSIKNKLNPERLIKFLSLSLNKIGIPKTKVGDRIKIEVDTFFENLSREIGVLEDDEEYYLSEILPFRLMAGIFVQNFLMRISFKNDISFYATVMGSILENKKSPLTSLKYFLEFFNDKESDEPVRFAMIGDRFHKDIKPPSILLNNNALTIQLRAGEYSSFKNENNTQFRPKYFTDTLAQVKALLMDKNVWRGVSCVRKLTLLNVKMTFDEQQKPDKSWTKEKIIELAKTNFQSHQNKLYTFILNILLLVFKWTKNYSLQ